MIHRTASYWIFWGSELQIRMSKRTLLPIWEIKQVPLSTRGKLSTIYTRRHWRLLKNMAETHYWSRYWWNWWLNRGVTAFLSWTITVISGEFFFSILISLIGAVFHAARCHIRFIFYSRFGSFLGHMEGWFESIANVIVFKGVFLLSHWSSCQFQSYVLYLALRSHGVIVFFWRIVEWADYSVAPIMHLFMSRNHIGNPKLCTIPVFRVIPTHSSQITHSKPVTSGRGWCETRDSVKPRAPTNASISPSGHDRFGLIG